MRADGSWWGVGGVEVSLSREWGCDGACWSSGTTGRLCWEDMRDRDPSPLPITVIWSSSAEKNASDCVSLPTEMVRCTTASKLCWLERDCREVDSRMLPPDSLCPPAAWRGNSVWRERLDGILLWRPVFTLSTDRRKSERLPGVGRLSGPPGTPRTASLEASRALETPLESESVT